MDLISTISHNALSFIVIISVIVFIHEFGHYWVAKKCGVRILAFSIGFGPELFGWNDKSGTRWKVSLIPMGGYVKMFGDEGAASTPDNETISEFSEEDKKVAFHTQSLPKRFAIVLAGPMANFILSIVILSAFFIINGRPETASVVASVVEESAAAQAGMLPGDRIIELGGESVSRFSQVRDITVLHPGIPLEMTYERDGKTVETTITPKLVKSKDAFGGDIEVGQIGITGGEMVYEELGVVHSLWASVEETFSICQRTLKVVGQMITGDRDSNQLSGILRISEYSGKSVDKGMAMVFWFMAMLSINLGLVNLFPIPMLDGGHLFMYMIEAVRRKPLSEKVQEMLFRGGFVILIMLMVFATYNDLKHFGIFES